MTRFWWVRHGPTHAKAMVGWTDLPADLSDVAALKRLAGILPAGAVVVSSDLSRAVATADAVQGARVRLAHDPRLREIHFGAWEGKGWAEIDGPEARAFWDGAAPAPGGEGWGDLCARVWDAMDALMGLGDVVVVAHFGAILAALQRAQGCSAVEVLAQRVEPLSLTEISGGPDAWTVGRVNHIA